MPFLLRQPPDRQEDRPLPHLQLSADLPRVTAGAAPLRIQAIVNSHGPLGGHPKRPHHPIPESLGDTDHPIHLTQGATQRPGVEPPSAVLDLVVREGVVNRGHNHLHSGHTPGQGSVEGRPRPMGLQHPDPFAPEEHRQAQQGEGVDQGGEAHHARGYASLRHTSDKGSRFRADEQWTIARPVQPVQQQLQIPFPASVAG